MSYNIHSAVGNDGKFDYARIGKYLSEVGADIVCLQEFDLRKPDLEHERVIDSLKASHFKHFVATPAVKTEDGYYGNAMLTKFNPTSVNELRIDYKDNQARNIQHLTFNINNKNFNVMNTHFGLNSKERYRQFLQLKGYINKVTEKDKHPLLVLGDFNEWMPITKMLTEMNSLLTPTKLAASFPSRFPVFKLDKAWASCDVSIQSAKTLKDPFTKLYSDHLPILISAEI